MLTCQISSQSVYSVALRLQKTPNFTIFGLWHNMVLPFGSMRRKLYVDAKLQTFYLTVSKLFLCSSAFVAKSCAQTLVIQKHEGHTNTQPKSSIFCPSWQQVKSEPHQAWHGNRGPRACSCTSKTFGDPMYSFIARGY